MSAPKVGMISLGCAKNLVDSEGMLGRLKAAGFEITPDRKEADVLVVNTCGFIDVAKEESIEAILEAAREKDQGKCRGLIVTGCLAQRYRKELEEELPEVDLFLGLDEEGQVVRAARQLTGFAGPDPEDYHRLRVTPRHYSYLKIAEGCSNRCSFCAIPSIRGPLRSVPREEVLEEARRLARDGAVELNLIAQDLTAYGQDLYDDYRLADLVHDLCRVEETRWLRLLYTYPEKIDDRLIEVMATEEKVCHYLDMPVQHASPRILRAMKRPADPERTLRLIEGLRQAIPDIALRTSIIVGFPGEEEEDFRALLDFIRQARFNHLGAFIYSPEENTPAAGYEGVVPLAVKEGRKRRLMALQRKISAALLEEEVGSVTPVLVEGTPRGHEGVMVGRTGRQAPEVDGGVVIPGARVEPGIITDVLITGSGEYDLIGVVR